MPVVYLHPVNPRVLLGVTVLGLIGLISDHVRADEKFEASNYLTGDWGGLRSELHDKGADITVEYVGEAAANLHGGYNQDKTARYTDQLALGTTLDMNKLAGWQGAKFQLMITERSGRNLAGDRIGDPRAGMLSSTQEVYGRGQTWRLTQMWLSQEFLDGDLDVKFGRFGEGEDFNTFPCDFQNNAFGFGVARIHVNPAVAKHASLTNQLAGINNYDNPAFMPIRDGTTVDVIDCRESPSLAQGT